MNLDGYIQDIVFDVSRACKARSIPTPETVHVHVRLNPRGDILSENEQHAGDINFEIKMDGYGYAPEILEKQRQATT